MPPQPRQSFGNIDQVKKIFPQRQNSWKTSPLSNKLSVSAANHSSISRSECKWYLALQSGKRYSEVQWSASVGPRNAPPGCTDATRELPTLGQWFARFARLRLCGLQGLKGFPPTHRPATPPSSPTSQPVCPCPNLPTSPSTFPASSFYVHSGMSTNRRQGRADKLATQCRNALQYSRYDSVTLDQKSKSEQEDGLDPSVGRAGTR